MGSVRQPFTHLANYVWVNVEVGELVSNPSMARSFLFLFIIEFIDLIVPSYEFSFELIIMFNLDWYGCLNFSIQERVKFRE